jgi:ribosomal protein S18 acetylase RimI-like enzyme
MHPDELDAVVAFVSSHQRDPAAATAYVGDDPREIATYLTGLGPDWASRCLLVERSGRLVGFLAVELDDEVGRAWLLGPVVEDEEWDVVAPALMDEALNRVVPASIPSHELAGDAANTRLAQLASLYGLSPGELNHALELPREGALALHDAVPRPGPTYPPEVTLLAPKHHAAMEALHDLAFPGTYRTGRQLVRRHEAGESVVVVLADPDGALQGYASGQVDAAGEGYIEFLAVAEGARGRGLGRRLVVSLARRLVRDPGVPRVHLVVVDSNDRARRLYAALGFTTAARLVGYSDR